MYTQLTVLLQGLFKSTRRGDTEHRYKRTERVTETTYVPFSAFRIVSSTENQWTIAIGTLQVTNTNNSQPVVSAPVVNRGNETTHGGPAYEANSNTFGPTQGTVREPGYVANTSNIGTNQGNIRSPGYVVHNDTLESTLGTARGTGLGAARDPGYSVQAIQTTSQEKDAEATAIEKGATLPKSMV